MSAASIDDISDLFARYGGDPYDEVVTQLAHALQCAALAADAGAGDPLVAAALLHDVGHLLDMREGGASAQTDLKHEDRGAAWLRPLLPVSVTAPIALHVRAKRYLCRVEPDYAATLSTGSVRSLALQGGPMSSDEVRDFEGAAGFGDAVLVRRWDDAAKVAGLDVPGFDSYRALLDGLTRA